MNRSPIAGPGANVLYISYDGILEPLGQSQVLQYLKKLAVSHRIYLISFEKPSDWEKTTQRQEMEKAVSEARITWFPLTYHKTPTVPATAFDILQGFLIGLYFCLTKNIRIVHARSYIAGVMALGLKICLGTKFIFDMRGFWADERVDGGLWKADSAIFQVAKWFERKFLKHSDCIISLTHAAKTEISRLYQAPGKIRVIPTCTNLEFFSVEGKAHSHNVFRENEPKGSVEGAPSAHFAETPLPLGRGILKIGYVGSVGLWYLFEPVLECFSILLKLHPTCQLEIFNRDEHAFIQRKVEEYALPRNQVFIEALSFTECAKRMRHFHGSLFFIKPVFSKKASAPTKLGELLGSGIPCLTNAGVGDVEEILEDEKVGVVVKDFSRQSLEEGVRRFLELLKSPDISVRCRQTAEKYFSLEQGFRAYDRIYRSLSSPTSSPK